MIRELSGGIFDTLIGKAQSGSYELGKDTADLIWSSFKSEADKISIRQQKVSKAPDIVKPFLDPFVKGIQDGLSNKVKIIVGISLTALTLALLGGFYLGRRSKR